MARIWPWVLEDPPYMVRIKVPKYYLVSLPNKVGDTEYYLVILKYPSRARSIQ